MNIKKNFINLADPAIFQTFGGEEYWEKVEVPAGTKILSEGDDTTDFYYIISGTVMVSKTMEQGVEKELARLSDGDFFGEGSLLSERVRTATVTTLNNCSFYKLGSQKFASVVANDCQTANALLLGVVKGMNDRLFAMNNRLMALLDVSTILSQHSGDPQTMMPAVFEELSKALGHSNIVYFGMDGMPKFQHSALSENALMNMQMQVPNFANRLQTEGAHFFVEDGMLYGGIRNLQGQLIGLLVSEVSEKNQNGDLRLLMSVAEQMGHVLGQ